MIGRLNKRIDEIYKDLKIDSYTNVRDKIRAAHDYIINNTRYDSLKISNIEDQTYSSNIAYGPIFQGYAVCSGYADAMAIFLDKMGIPNMKVASATHVWNLVYVDNKWYHLDLTWDDPYTSSDINVINHNFFLISYYKLKQWDTTEHTFDQNIYREAL
jgi:transglutaminase/protease-like cytokinesis protein 3